MRTLAALVLAVPLSALAQAAPVGSPPSEPQWSLGAGVFLEFITLRGSLNAFSTAQIAPATVPGVTTSLERRLAPSTWLVVGATTSWRDSELDIAPAGTGISRWREVAAALAGGIRQVATGPGAPVEVSLLALVGAGFDSVQATIVQSGVRDDQRADGWAASASLGLALERELASRLSLRVASPLLQVTYLSTTQRAGGGASQRGHDLTAGLALAPRLELRLAF